MVRVDVVGSDGSIAEIIIGEPWRVRAEAKAHVRRLTSDARKRGTRLTYTILVRG